MFKALSKAALLYLLALNIGCGSDSSTVKEKTVQATGVISIASSSTSIWEGQSFHFSVNLSQPIEDEFIVEVAINDSSSSNSFVINNSEPIVFSIGESSVYVPVDISDVSGKQGERTIELEILSTSTELVKIDSNKSKYSLTLLDGLQDRLYRPLKVDYENQKFLDAWNDTRSLSFVNVNFDPWALPIDPDWTENPYQNVSWQFYYHSLVWLQTLVHGYEETSDEAYVEEIKSIVFDWIKDNPIEEGDPNRAWNDHATAYRASMFAYLYERFFKGNLDDVESTLYRDAVVLHGEVLSDMLPLPQWVGHNHGLFHSLGLLSIAKVFPNLPQSDEWRVSAVSRIDELSFEMVDATEGISNEQAIAYHYAAIDLFIEISNLLEGLMELGNTSLLKNINALIDFSSLTMLPNGVSPALGDTNWGADYSGFLSFYVKDKGLGSEISQFIVSKGNEGITPSLVNVYPNNGYVLSRKKYSNSDEWGNDHFLFADFGKSRLSHGHHDSLSFTYYQNGVQWLVDSGGPYRYADRQYKYFATAYAHNLVVVDLDRYIDVNAKLNQVSSSENVLFINGEREQNKVNSNRSILTLGEKYLIVIDKLTQSDSFRHWYELLFHFAPNTKIVIQDSINDKRLNASIAYTYNNKAVFSEASIFSSFKIRESAVIEGRYDEDVSPLNMQGWVSDGFNSKLPAPVLYAKYRTEDIWLVSVFSNGNTEEQALDYSANVSENGDGSLDIELKDSESSFDISISSTNELVINGENIECNDYCPDE